MTPEYAAMMAETVRAVEMLLALKTLEIRRKARVRK
jgi:hypothetical protein